MAIIIGLIIIAIGAFCQSSSYVPINKVKEWSWESFWLTQGVFAWLIFPFLGALLAVPSGHSLCELFTADNSFNIWMTILFGVLWGVGGLTFGLSMRYLGVALGQSIALGTCAALGTILGPVMLNIVFPNAGHLEKLTSAVLIGVLITLLGIAIIGVAGHMKAQTLSEEEKRKELRQIIKEEDLKPAETEDFMERAFADGYVTETGTGIAHILPALNPFLPESGEKKQTVIEKLKAYLNKFADMLSDDSAGFDVYRTKKLDRVEDDEALRNFIDSRLDMTADISDMMLQREVIAQFGDTYPAMKPKDWMHLIHSYITHEDIEDNSCLMAAESLDAPKED